MKNDIILLQGDEARVIAHVDVALISRMLPVRLVQLVKTGEYYITRGDFLREGYPQDRLNDAKAYFARLVLEEAF